MLAKKTPAYILGKSVHGLDLSEGNEQKTTATERQTKAAVEKIINKTPPTRFLGY
jgi:hypothetical protein